MKSASHEATDDRVFTASVAGSVEGYLALLLVVFLFLGPQVDHPGNPIGGAVYIGIAFGLAQGGVRFGKGCGRLAAKLAFGVLSLLLLVILAASIARWEEVVWYWRQ